MGAPSPPPPNRPIISPDGKYYWADGHWIPRFPPGPPPSSPSSVTPVLVVVGGFLLLVVIGVLVWYFGYYDTAQGKCNRGDFGACLVVAGQQAAASASASAAAASASASAQASADAAAQQAYQSTVDQLRSEMASGCTVVPKEDQYNDVRVTYIGPNKDVNCQNALKTGQWIQASRVSGSSIVCWNNALVIEDTGGRLLGTQMCDQLQLPIQPAS